MNRIIKSQFSARSSANSGNKSKRQQCRLRGLGNHALKRQPTNFDRANKPRKGKIMKKYEVMYADAKLAHSKAFADAMKKHPDAYGYYVYNIADNM